MEHFLEWLRLNKIYHEKIEIKQSSDGYGVYALEDLEEQDVIARISKESVLSSKNASCRDLLEEENIGGGAALTIAVMYEMQLGKSSRWWGYLQILPESVELPIFWQQEDLEWLKGTELYDSISIDKEHAISDYQEIVKPLMAKCNKFDQNFCTLEKYLDVSSVVASRAFYVDNYHEDSLVPLADMFNHKTQGEHIHVESNTEVCGICGVSSGCPHDSDTESHDDSMELELTIVRRCPKGCQVYNTYGDHGNAFLLGKYGFAEEDNPCDGVGISSASLLKLSNIKDSKQRLRWFQKQFKDDFEFFEVSYDGTVEDKLKLFLVLMLEITDHEFAYEKSKLKTRLQIRTMDAAILMKAIEERLREYSTENEPSNCRTKWAVLCRDGEKRILMRAYDRLRNKRPIE